MHHFHLALSFDQKQSLLVVPCPSGHQPAPTSTPAMLKTPVGDSHPFGQTGTPSRGNSPSRTKQRLRGGSLTSARPRPSQPELQPPQSVPRISRRPRPSRLRRRTAQARRSRTRGRPAAGVSGRCNLLRRRPRKRADPGLVADSDVGRRTKTEAGRKPEARSRRRSVPEAPGGLSAEPSSRPPSSPPRRLFSGRVSVSSAAAHLLLTPVFPGGVLRLSRAAVATTQRDGCSGSVVPGRAGESARENPAAVVPGSSPREERGREPAIWLFCRKP